MFEQCVDAYHRNRNRNCVGVVDVSSYLSSVEVGWRRLMSAASCHTPLLPGAGSTLSLGLFNHHPHHRGHLLPLQFSVHTMGGGALCCASIRPSSYLEAASDQTEPSSCSHPPGWFQLGVSRIIKESAAKTNIQNYLFNIFPRQVALVVQK